MVFIGDFNDIVLNRACNGVPSCMNTTTQGIRFTEKPIIELLRQIDLNSQSAPDIRTISIVDDKHVPSTPSSSPIVSKIKKCQPKTHYMSTNTLAYPHQLVGDTWVPL